MYPGSLSTVFSTRSVAPVTDRIDRFQFNETGWLVLVGYVHSVSEYLAVFRSLLMWTIQVHGTYRPPQLLRILSNASLEYMTTCMVSGKDTDFFRSSVSPGFLNFSLDGKIVVHKHGGKCYISSLLHVIDLNPLEQELCIFGKRMMGDGFIPCKFPKIWWSLHGTVET